MNIIRTIAVVGATGMLGAPVTKVLKKQGYSVTAVVRNMQKVHQKLGAGMHLFKGDLKDKRSLRSAFADIDFVYLNLSTTPDEKKNEFKTEIDGLQNVIEAAKSARVKRIGFLSSLVKDYSETDWWVFDIKREACRILKEADIPVTIFYPSSFYENLAHLQMKGNRVYLAGDQVTKSWWISAEDYGMQVANAFRKDLESHEDFEYSIQGPEPYNMEEAADIFIRHHPNPKLKKAKAPLGLFRLMKPFSSTIDFQYNILYAINHYDEKFQSEQTWSKLGKPELSLAEWAEKQG
ncbi:NAD-dependent epimerase/dehydratase family protein [Rhodohalobacter sp. SW132]|uniref:SDR family oxidoreductase n=1 Tax=Rhodohalobacter sp. SW132 TaxID=2293433 RepID=UPI000E258104|nr:NmrA family NAD(P)-binding protein [Rhodohalobacter sp. SW132]REL38499.1 NAD-dependent epimerase/dehydratase family protein [Rhodohalobacter sp. SW132]